MPALLEAIQRLNIPTEPVDDTTPVSIRKVICFMTDNMMQHNQEAYEDFWFAIAGEQLISRDENHARYAFKYLVQTILQDINRGKVLVIGDIIERALVATDKHLEEYDFVFNNEQRMTTSTETVDGVVTVTHTPKAAKGGVSNKTIVKGIMEDPANISCTKAEFIELIVAKLGVKPGNAGVYIHNYNTHLKSQG